MKEFEIGDPVFYNTRSEIYHGRIVNISRYPMSIGILWLGTFEDLGDRDITFQTTFELPDNSLQTI